MPNVSNATDIAFERPCDTIDDCANWFCTDFMKGPVADPSKVAYPSNSEHPVVKAEMGGKSLLKKGDAPPENKG